MNDYISRDDALLHSEIIRVYSKDYGNIDVVPVEYLADIPAADVQPVNQWISTNESLPSDNKPYVVVTAKNGLGVSRLMGRNKLEWTLFGEPVLYWLPIPEPPKDGDTNG